MIRTKYFVGVEQPIQGLEQHDTINWLAAVTAVMDTGSVPPSDESAVRTFGAG